MPQYSEGFRERAVQMMMPPNAISVAQVSRETGVSEQTLYNWRNRFRHEGRAVPADAKNPENWSGENKLAVVIETAALNEEQLAEYCRKKGLYVEQIARWREAAIAGAETLKPLSAEERRELELSTCCRAGQSFCIKRTAPSAPRTASFLATFLISETASRRRWHASLDARQP
jgi:transposase